MVLAIVVSLYNTYKVGSVVPFRQNESLQLISRGPEFGSASLVANFLKSYGVGSVIVKDFGPFLSLKKSS